MREKAERGANFPEEDRFFHRTIAEATGNHLLLKLLDVFWTVFSRSRDRALTVNTALERTWRNHATILHAAEAGDAVRARAAMAEHFSDIEERVERAGLRAGQHLATPHTRERDPV